MLQDNDKQQNFERNYKNNKSNKNPYDLQSESYNNSYDYDYNQYNSLEEEQTSKESSFAGMQRLILIQVIACIIIIIFTFAFKAIGGQYYDQFKNWYTTELNKSIVIGDTADEYKSAYALTSQILKEKVNQGEDISVSTDANISECNTTENENQSGLTFTTTLTNPVANAQITSTFTDPQGHKALDLATSENSDIVSALSGTVEIVSQNDSYGNYIIIDNGNSIKTLYAHCNNISVQTGQQVTRGSKIATVGSTGNSTGPHLHFELLVNNIPYDPLPLMQEEYV